MTTVHFQLSKPQTSKQTRGHWSRLLRTQAVANIRLRQATTHSTLLHLNNKVPNQITSITPLPWGFSLLEPPQCSMELQTALQHRCRSSTRTQKAHPYEKRPESITLDPYPSKEQQWAWLNNHLHHYQDSGRTCQPLKHRRETLSIRARTCIEGLECLVVECQVLLRREA